jgi:chromosomal replication initiator protein
MTLHVETITPTQAAAREVRRRLDAQIKSHAMPDRQAAKSVAIMAAAPAIQPTPSESDRFGSPVDPALTFDSFVTGPSNTMAGAAVMHVLQKPAEFWPLVLFGRSGMGKTHLLQAVANASEAALYLTSEWVVANLKALPSIPLSPYRVVLIDDIQFVRSHNAKEDLAALMRGLRSRSKGLIITCDDPPCDLNLEADIKSRISGGLILELSAHDRELRFELIKRRFNGAGLKIEPECLTHLADTLSGGRELEGTVNRLIAGAKMMGIRINMASVLAALSDRVLSKDAKRISIKDIQRLTARNYNVRHADIISARRTAQVTHPRQIACYLAKQLTPCSFPEIGRRFGNRDHTTVLHAFRKIEGMMARNSDFKLEVELLQQKIFAELS